MPRPIRYCVIDGCEERQVGRGWCRKHYTRWWEQGRLHLLPKNPRYQQPCAIEGCDKPQKARDWCQTHYRRWQRYGDVTFTKKYQPTGRWGAVTTAPERWWKHVNQDGPFSVYALRLGPCWLWTGAPTSTGYGVFSYQYRNHMAHLWGYEQFIGPIPEGMELDHLCHNRLCVRWSHLEPVTHRENVNRGFELAGTSRRGTNRKAAHTP